MLELQIDHHQALFWNCVCMLDEMQGVVHMWSLYPYFIFVQVCVCVCVCAGGGGEINPRGTESQQIQDRFYVLFLLLGVVTKFIKIQTVKAATMSSETKINNHLKDLKKK